MEDKINHPHHYNNSQAHCGCGRRIECIDVTRHMDFNIGNVIKYLWRYQDKNGLEDLKKAQWYLHDLIVYMEGSVLRGVVAAWEKPNDDNESVVFNHGCKL